MQIKHCGLHVTGNDARHQGKTALDGGLDRLAVGRRRRREHPVGDAVSIARMPDTEAQTPEIGHAKLCRNITQAIMPGDTPALLQTRHTGQQIEFVMNDQRFGRCDAKESRQRHHRLPRPIHVGLGQDEKELVASARAPGNEPLVLRILIQAQT